MAIASRKRAEQAKGTPVASVSVAAAEVVAAETDAQDHAEWAKAEAILDAMNKVRTAPAAEGTAKAPEDAKEALDLAEWAKAEAILDGIEQVRAADPSAATSDEAAASPPSPEPAKAPPTPPVAAAKGSLADSAQQEMLVKVPVADVFGVVTDFAKYPKWVTGLKKVDILEVDEKGRGQVAEFSAGAFGLSISYTLSYTFDEPEEVSWISIAGGVKSIIGQYRLTAAEGGTRVQYRLDVDAGFGIPGPIRKGVTKLVIGAALPDLKRYLESGKYK